MDREGGKARPAAPIAEIAVVAVIAEGGQRRGHWGPFDQARFDKAVAETRVGYSSTQPARQQIFCFKPLIPQKH